MSPPTLYISNISEDVWSFIESLDDAVKKNEIEENALLADRDLFAFVGVDHLRLILPYPIDENFWRYYLALFPNRDCRCWSPRQHSGRTCLDIMQDQALLRQILIFAGTKKRLRLLSYSATSEFYQLKKRLEQLGLTVDTPESPMESAAWTVDHFGSKSGLRQTLQRLALPLCSLAPGAIASNFSQTLRLAKERFRQSKDVVIKTNKGHSGLGVLIYHQPASQQSSQDEATLPLITTLRQNRYWQLFPTVVEEFIPTDLKVAGGCPDLEFKIDAAGRLQYLYFCGMRVNRQGIFQGLEINQRLLNQQQRQKLLRFGRQLGRIFAQAGYRGYFDLDFISGQNGQFFLSESNVRRTGGTHVYHLARKIYGRNFMRQAYILAVNIYPLKNPVIQNFQQLQQQLQTILWQPQQKEGVIIASANLLQKAALAYVVLGQSKARSLAYEKQLKQLLTY